MAVVISATYAQSLHVRALMEREITGKTASAIVTLAGNLNGQIYFQEAMGKTSFSKRAYTIQEDAIFDVASLSKIITAMSVMKLVQDQELGLKTTLLDLFGKRLVPRDKRMITIEMLLRHRSGLFPIANKLEKKHLKKTKNTVKHLLTYKLSNKPGTTFLYSDINFMLLAQIVAFKTQNHFYDHLHQQTFPDLMMTDSYTHVVPSELNARRVVSQLRPDKLVNDPRAMLMDKGAGHAGVFSTAQDLKMMILNLLGQGSLLNSKTAKKMIQTGPLGLRGLGVDVASKFNRSLKGKCFGPKAFGHTGYTGTSFIADPVSGDFLLILTNRRISKREDAGSRLNKLRTNLANEVCR